MNPVLQSSQFVLRLVRDFIAFMHYAACGAGSLQASGFAPSRAAAQRLVAGLRLAEAFLRRVLILMALELEPTLVDVPQKLARPRDARPVDRAKKPKAKAEFPSFKIFQKMPAIPEAVMTKMRDGEFRRVNTSDDHRQPVYIGRLTARLDNIAAIAADPLARAMRLAFHMARHRHGPMFEPDRHVGPSSSLGRVRKLWNTEIPSSFDAIGEQIRTKSRARPPPLSPRSR